MGAEVKRKEDPRLITGRSTYVTDVVLPGMHHVAFVRSPHAHARIRRIDASAATRRPGVFTVVTGEDIRTRLRAAAARRCQRGRQRPRRRQHRAQALPALPGPGAPRGRGRRRGRRDLGSRGGGRRRRDRGGLEPLPAVTDPFAAMAGGAPQVHDDAPGNVEHKNAIKAGDSDGAFARARRSSRSAW